MRWFRFRKDPHHEYGERRRRRPVISLILMTIGLLTVLYVLIVFVIIPVLAALTPRT